MSLTVEMVPEPGMKEKPVDGSRVRAEHLVAELVHRTHKVNHPLQACPTDTSQTIDLPSNYATLDELTPRKGALLLTATSSLLASNSDNASLTRSKIGPSTGVKLLWIQELRWQGGEAQGKAHIIIPPPESCTF